jgi:hypothetical protein
MKTKLLIFAIGVGIFALGWFADSIFNNVANEIRTYPIREDSAKYQYINPLILLDNSSAEYKELDPLKTKVKDYIFEEVKNHKAERISFYFRDLNSSMWTGINPDDEFVPASILKVGTVMVYLRIAEEDINVVNQK